MVSISAHPYYVSSMGWNNKLRIWNCRYEDELICVLHLPETVTSVQVMYIFMDIWETLNND